MFSPAVANSPPLPMMAATAGRTPGVDPQAIASSYVNSVEADVVVNAWMTWVHTCLEARGFRLQSAETLVTRFRKYNGMRAGLQHWVDPASGNVLAVEGALIVGQRFPMVGQCTLRMRAADTLRELDDYSKHSQLVLAMTPCDVSQEPDAATAFQAWCASLQQSFEHLARTAQQEYLEPFVQDVCAKRTP